MKVGRVDEGILKYGAVLNDVLVALADFDNLLETLVNVLYLEIERPARHVLIEVIKIGIVFNGFETRRPVISFCQHLG